MQIKSTNDIGNFVFLIDNFVTIVVFLLAFYIRSLSHLAETSLHISSHLFIIPLTLALLSSFLTYFGAYASPHNNSLSRYAWAIVRAVVFSIGLLLGLLFFLHIEYVSRMVIVLFSGFELIALVLVRYVVVVRFQKLVKSGERALKLLIVGSKSRAADLLEALEEKIIFGVEVVGFVDPDPKYVGTIIKGVPVIGTVENIHDCLKDNVIDEVIIAIPRSLLKDAEPIVLACEEEGIKLRFMADIFNVKVARVTLSDVKGIPLLTMEPVSQDPQQLLAKRIFDLSLTIVALPFLVPLFFVVAIAIKIESKGPVFFVQNRIGFRKYGFPMLKFRSMYENAEAQMKDIEHLNEADGPIFKMKYDPRVTKVGRFIRKTSIDELPQLINVLRGEMSLVGPRPMSERDVELFDKGIQRKRFSVQPGLTCIWQVSGRSNLTFENWLELDLQYIDTWTFGLDIQLLIRTIPAVLFSKGAV